jgi:hypothetical protein
MYRRNTLPTSKRIKKFSTAILRQEGHRDNAIGYGVASNVESQTLLEIRRVVSIGE